MVLYDATATRAMRDAERVARARVELAGGMVENALVVTRAHASWRAHVEGDLRHGSFRRTFARDLPESFSHQLFGLLLEVTRGWAERYAAPAAARAALAPEQDASKHVPAPLEEDACKFPLGVWAEPAANPVGALAGRAADAEPRHAGQTAETEPRHAGQLPAPAAAHASSERSPQADLAWGVTLYDARGCELRSSHGVGVIAEAPTFLALAETLDGIVSGFAADVPPIRALRAALAEPDPLAYSRALDAVAGGEIAFGLGMEYLHEALLSFAGSHRTECLREARARFLDAAELGHARAFAFLGRLSDGLIGEGDVRRALRCYERAAQLGSAEGCFLLADKLAEGEGCRKDAAAARMWYERAHQQALNVRDPEVWGLAAERLATSLAASGAPEADLARARDLAFDAELGISAALTSGRPWLARAYRRAVELSDRLAQA